MQTKTPTFEFQLHIETQQYLAKSCRWLSVLSFILTFVIFVSIVINNPDKDIVFTSLSLTPITLISLFGLIHNFALSENLQVNNYKRFYAFIFALVLCWVLVCNLFLFQALSAQTTVESLIHLILISFVVALFPSRGLLIVPVLIIGAYLVIARVFFFSIDLFIPVIKMLSFFAVIISGQQVVEKWFRKAVFKDVENQRLVSELNQLALTDSLTKLSNRRHFDSMLNKEIQHSERTGLPLSIILMDIDYFKKLNDYLGHQRGDECLVELAKLLTKQIKRPRDVCARYGGEEFIVLLPETDLSGAIDVANNIKIQLSQMAFKHPDSLASEFVTLSQGVVQWHSGMTLERLVKHADDKLYEVKDSSRNNIAH
ncbi:membrane-associated sensor domain-containing protein [Shewanella electrodiphila]|uniref:diguanylate cyclase n=1 Tax=Shewanella electrodiphila TaxID=934143 RepID=A0ABT0KS11_9GAMM|nr:membrane-associated sensor domain-containing protein [Shewanella electrodiphila]MCL1046647.1 membrane-associated sensor domain-containing protein [Shewanella electrodiphila]